MEASDSQAGLGSGLVAGADEATATVCRREGSVTGGSLAVADAVGIGFNLRPQPEAPEELFPGLELWLTRSDCWLARSDFLKLAVSDEDRLRVTPFSSALMLRGRRRPHWALKRRSS